MDHNDNVILNGALRQAQDKLREVKNLRPTALKDSSLRSE